MNKKLLRQSIIESIKYIFTSTDYIHERTWTAEIIYQLSKILSKEYFIHSEEPIGASGRIDIGITDSSDTLLCGIELKGIYEAPFPLELLNNMENDVAVYRNFILKAKVIIENKSMHGKRSLYPKTSNGRFFINQGFFEDIVELNNQYNRLLRMHVLGFVIYVDHNDDYTIRKRTYAFSEDRFKNNFSFRKRIVEKLIGYSKDTQVEYLHFVKFNSETGAYIELLT